MVYSAYFAMHNWKLLKLKWPLSTFLITNLSEGNGILLLICLHQLFAAWVILSAFCRLQILKTNFQGLNCLQRLSARIQILLWTGFKQNQNYHRSGWLIDYNT